MACFLPHSGLAGPIYTGSKIGEKSVMKWLQKPSAYVCDKTEILATFHMDRDLWGTNWHSNFQT